MKASRKGMSALMFLALVLGMLDFMTITAAVGIAASAVSIPHVNEPPKDVAERTTPVAPTVLYSILNWKDGEPHDVDGWHRCTVQRASGPLHYTVNYRQRSDGFLDLLRDDLGRPSYLNAELVQSNSEINQMPPNTVCRVNVHLYHSHTGSLPVEGHLIVILNKDAKNEVLLADVPFELARPGQEVTVAAIAFDGDGNPLTDAISTYPDAETVPIATVHAP